MLQVVTNLLASFRLSFTYPMVALINLFVCVLKNMRQTTADSDLSLLDMAAGHFARMELITAYQLSFPFGREVASLARQSLPSSHDEPLARDTGTLAYLMEHDLSSLDWSLFEDVRYLDLF